MSKQTFLNQQPVRGFFSIANLKPLPRTTTGQIVFEQMQKKRQEQEQRQEREQSEREQRQREQRQREQSERQRQREREQSEREREQSEREREQRQREQRQREQRQREQRQREREQQQRFSSSSSLPNPFAPRAPKSEADLIPLPLRNILDNIIEPGTAPDLCPSHKKRPTYVSTRANWMKQNILFHPDKNLGCKSNAEEKFKVFQLLNPKKPEHGGKRASRKRRPKNTKKSRRQRH